VSTTAACPSASVASELQHARDVLLVRLAQRDGVRVFARVVVLLGQAHPVLTDVEQVLRRVREIGEHSRTEGDRAARERQAREERGHPF